MEPSDLKLQILRMICLCLSLGLGFWCKSKTWVYFFFVWEAGSWGFASSKCTTQDAGMHCENQQVNVIFSFSPLGEKIVYKEWFAVVPTNPQWRGLHTFAWLVGLNLTNALLKPALYVCRFLSWWRKFTVHRFVLWNLLMWFTRAMLVGGYVNQACSQRLVCS